MGDDEVSLEPGCYRGDIAAVLTPAGTIVRTYQGALAVSLYSIFLRYLSW